MDSKNVVESELIVKANVEKYDDVYRSGYDKKYPTLDLVRLEGWFFNKQPGKVLDFACGTGVNLIHMIDCGYTGVGVDASDESIKLVQKKIDSHPSIASKCKVIKLDPKQSKLPFDDNEFDYIIAMSILSLLESKERIRTLVDEFHRILRPMGKMIIDINGPSGDFAQKGKYIDDDTFEYVLRSNQKEPITLYCPKTKEIFARILERFSIDDLGHTSFGYCGKHDYEFIACVHKT